MSYMVFFLFCWFFVKSHLCLVYKILFVELLAESDNPHTLKYLCVTVNGTNYWSSRITLFMYFRLNVESSCPRWSNLSPSTTFLVIIFSFWNLSMTLLSVSLFAAVWSFDSWCSVPYHLIGYSQDNYCSFFIGINNYNSISFL